MKTKLISTTNHYFANSVGLEGDLDIGQVFYFHPYGGGLSSQIRSSYITNVKQEDIIITINTRNSIYVFEALEEEVIDTFSMSEKEISEKEELVRQYEHMLI